MEILEGGNWFWSISLTDHHRYYYGKLGWYCTRRSGGMYMVTPGVVTVGKIVILMRDRK